MFFFYTTEAFYFWEHAEQHNSLTMEHKWGCRLHPHVAVDHFGTASFFGSTLPCDQLGDVRSLLTNSSKAYHLQGKRTRCKLYTSMPCELLTMRDFLNESSSERNILLNCNARLCSLKGQGGHFYTLMIIDCKSRVELPRLLECLILFTYKIFTWRSQKASSPDIFQV